MSGNNTLDQNISKMTEVLPLFKNEYGYKVQTSDNHEFRVLLNCQNKDEGESFYNKKITLGNNASNEEKYLCIMEKILRLFELSTGSFEIQIASQDTGKVHEFIFIKELIIDFIKSIIWPRQNINQGFNIEILYKMTYHAICKSPSAMKIFSNLQKNNLDLYNHIKKYGDTKIDTATKLGKMGF